MNYLIMLLAGMGIPLMAALSSNLSQQLPHPLFAGAITLAVGFIGIIFTTILLPDVSLHSLFSIDIKSPDHLPIPYYLGGLLIAFYLVSITQISPIIGLSQAIMLVLFGQIIAALVLEHHGWFGVVQESISIRKLTGAGLMLSGIMLAQYKL